LRAVGLDVVDPNPGMGEKSPDLSGKNILSVARLSFSKETRHFIGEKAMMADNLFYGEDSECG